MKNKKMTKKCLSFLLIITIMAINIPINIFMVNVSALEESITENTSEIFSSTSVTHLTEVPEGYVGIYTKQDLNNVRNNLNGNYILMNDIEFVDKDFSSNGNFYNDNLGWEPIGSGAEAFSGIFDGNDYEISGFCINSATSVEKQIGLFGTVSGTIKNLTISGKITVLNSSATSYVGSFAGNLTGTIINCDNRCTIDLNVSSRANQTTYFYLGGFAGYSTGRISNCDNNESIIAIGSARDASPLIGYIGGIAGYSGDGEIIACTNNDNIQVSTKAPLQATYATAYFYCGGIVGGLNSKIENCCNFSKISFNDISSTPNPYFSCTSGISGISETSAIILDSYNEGYIYNRDATYGYCAGISAYNYGNILRCYNSATISIVSSNKYADSNTYMRSGGIFAISSGTVQESYNLGNMSFDLERVSNALVGGIGGALLPNGVIINCYNTGGIPYLHHTTGYSAGIVADSEGCIECCYDVGATGHFSSICSRFDKKDKIINCYTTELTLEAFTSTNLGTALSLSEFTSQDSFVGFDFNNVWTLDTTISYSFPTLKNNPHNLNAINENKTEFAGGRGNLGDPYLISTPEHLDNASMYPSAHFKLINDINYSTLEIFDSYPEKLGKSMYLLKGSLNGNGYCIRNRQGGSLAEINYGAIVNLGMVSCVSSKAGIADESRGLIADCYFHGEAVSGIAYEVFGIVTRCYNFGNVKEGGICSLTYRANSFAIVSSGYISECCNFGTASAGIVFRAHQSTIENCFNAGNVSIAGIMASSDQINVSIPSIINCYNVGLVGNGNGEAITGTDGCSIENCYYLDGCAQGSYDYKLGIVELSAEKMIKSASYVGYDFANIWEIDKSDKYPYPKLRNVEMDSQKLTSIIVKEIPTKTEYSFGEQLDLTGLVVAEYNYITQTTTIISDYAVLGYDAFKYIAEYEGWQYIVIDYQGKQTFFKVKVNACTHVYDNECDEICNLCKEARTAHNFIHYEAKAPTCTESGWAEYDTCSLCNYTTYSGSIAPLGHRVITPKSEMKYPLEVTLYNCVMGDDGIYYTTNKEDNSIGGMKLFAIYDCTFEIKYSVSCEKGNDYVDVDFSYADSSFGSSDLISGEVDWKTATVSLVAGDWLLAVYCKNEVHSDNRDAGYFSFTCEDVLVEYNVDVPTNDIDPTCTEGVFCSYCNEEVKKAVDHSYDNVCDTDCNMCGTIRDITHAYDDWIIDRNPTCTITGSKHKVCTICHDIVTESIDSTGVHNYVGVVTDPTCTEQGFTTHTCDMCGDNYVNDYVKANGHSYDDDFDTTCNNCDFVREAKKHGDTSGDNILNNRDLAILMQYINGYNVQIDLDASDVNNDGKVNNKDYVLLMRYLNGWDVVLK